MKLPLARLDLLCVIPLGQLATHRLALSISATDTPFIPTANGNLIFEDVNCVDNINSILQPVWGSERWIQEGWDVLSADEKKSILVRIDELFADGLPFELKHDKILYMYAFSLLTQLEVLAIQVPLKFEKKMSNPVFQQQMRQQLLDEIFHGLVFTKITFLLSAPFSLPPTYNAHIEVLCNFIREEPCPKVALMLLNLIAEGWIEEVFDSLKAASVAPRVFEAILADEHRHVSEADLYRDIGIPDKDTAIEKLAFLERQLLTNIFMQYKYMFSLSVLLGAKGSVQFIENLDKKHRAQLVKIGLQPNDYWEVFMKFSKEFYPKILGYADRVHPVAMTPMRKVFMSQWHHPYDPTMVGQFNIDVTAIDFFARKFPKESLTLLFLQTVSLVLTKDESYRYFLSQNVLYKTEKVYVGLVVKLPDCADHLGTIVFEDCHLLSIKQIASRVKELVDLMVYCYMRRQSLEEQFPALVAETDQMLFDLLNDDYRYPFAGSSIASVTNIGYCGYTQCTSPLRCNESIKLTAMEVCRTPVWNVETKAFEPRDLLPVSLSADHRVFDGNVPFPKLSQPAFDALFAKMLIDLKSPDDARRKLADKDISVDLQIKIEDFIQKNPQVAHRTLSFLQTYWLDFLPVEEMLCCDWVNSHLVLA